MIAKVLALNLLELIKKNLQNPQQGPNDDIQEMQVARHRIFFRENSTNIASTTASRH